MNRDEARINDLKRLRMANTIIKIAPLTEDPPLIE